MGAWGQSGHAHRGLRAPGLPIRGMSEALQLLWSGRIGGIERQVAAISRYANAHGGGGARACFLDGRGVIGDALMAEGLADRLELRAGWDILGLWRFARLLRRRRPNVIHSHTHALLPTLVARLALPHAAFVYTEQSPRALDSDRKFRILYRLLRLLGCRFIALTPGMAHAMERYGISRARSAVIPNTFAIVRRTDAPTVHGPAPSVSSRGSSRRSERIC